MADDTHTRITLRIPSELIAAINGEAAATSKSQNAEIVGRLRASFSTQPAYNPPPLVQELVQLEMGRRNCTADEALTSLVLAGQANGGTVVQLKIQQGVTLEHLGQMVSAAVTLLPAGTGVYISPSA